ncbi:MAG: hypothetical protein AVDCRST_MAG25-3248 [uncultured Rubrobacteraceae bacterium]|uniref:Uncharacterized protein n=1 Tax=uncultured Rubrobacteraceae bacterium TaxID=349277 RepID=A0A6J4S4U2_9ACTN|nr:MAG: hypothetical protein AVDCRST_MAG25-3248 [uncultured Rubrobacteraceae bacterium]
MPIVGGLDSRTLSDHALPPSLLGNAGRTPALLHPPPSERHNSFPEIQKHATNKILPPSL